jgi:hypothetical protein
VLTDAAGVLSYVLPLPASCLLAGAGGCSVGQLMEEKENK